MAAWRGAGWTRVTQDQVVTSHPALLHGLVLLVSVTGAAARVHAGQDASSGRQIVTLEAVADENRQLAFNPPLRCEAGIYVDIDANVTEVLVAWDPMAAGGPSGGAAPGGSRG